MRGARCSSIALALALGACGGGTAGSSAGTPDGGTGSSSGGLALGGTTGPVNASSGGTSAGSSGGSAATSSGGSSTGVALGSSSSGTGGAGSSGSTSSGSSSTGGAGSSSGGTTGASGLPNGASCFQGADCASGLCKPVVENQSVCVSTCTSQGDCPSDAGAFCEPLSAGATSGYCVPQSPTACASCTQDSDCGRLSEACIPDPSGGDTCHPDCSLAGDAGCPPAYDCESVDVDGGARLLCMPEAGSCAEAPGGSCAIVSVAESCEDTNSAGTCTGQRTCQSSGWYSTCSAPVPQELPSCSATAPPGCTESLSPSAVDSVTNCGSCGNVCPGNGLTTDVVGCTPPCTFACSGENYDVDGNPANGCEVAASPQGNHTQANNIYLGAYDACDQQLTYNGANVGGVLPSDARVHEDPAVTGFDSATGSAPDWWSVLGQGGGDLGFCENDFQAELIVGNSAYPSCYQLTAFTSEGAPLGTSQTDSSGTAWINQNDQDNPNYNSGDTIYFEVSKICSTSDNDAPTFSFPNLHL